MGRGQQDRGVVVGRAQNHELRVVPGRERAADQRGGEERQHGDDVGGAGDTQREARLGEEEVIGQEAQQGGIDGDAGAGRDGHEEHGAEEHQGQARQRQPPLETGAEDDRDRRDRGGQPVLVEALGPLELAGEAATRTDAGERRVHDRQLEACAPIEQLLRDRSIERARERLHFLGEGKLEVGEPS